MPEKYMKNSSLCEDKAKSVRCIVLDVDGVLTDGRIVVGGQGGEWKHFDVKDGLRIAMARRQGVRIAFLTGRDSEAVTRRAAELSIDRIYQGVRDKGGGMARLLEDEGLRREEVAYLADDLPDLPAMREAGLAGAVGDAAREVIDAADWVAARPGGRGAVREFVEFILRSKGLWEQALGEYGG